MLFNSHDLHDNIVEFHVYGDSALFTNPISKTSGELCSYQLPTYSALQGIMRSIYWKPTIEWKPLAVRIMNPIQFETRSKKLLNYSSSGGDISFYTYLRNVSYQVRIALDWSKDENYKNDHNPVKHMDIAKRWIKRGGKCPIFLGIGECTGYVEPCTFGEGESHYDGVDIDFGVMFHSFTYANQAYDTYTANALTTNLWFSEMKNGIVTFPGPEECPIKRFVRNEEPIWIPPKKNLQAVDDEE